jgi:hypothetical protein
MYSDGASRNNILECEMDLSGSEQGPSVGCKAHGEEHSGFMIGQEVL